MSARMLRPSLGASQAGRCRATGSGPRSRSLNFAGGSKPGCLRSALQAHLDAVTAIPWRGSPLNRILARRHPGVIGRSTDAYMEGYETIRRDAKARRDAK